MAIDLFNLKTNEPVVALDNYFWLVAGVPKAGKTTLFAKLVERYYGDISKGLLLAFEKGYQALRVNAVDINEWDDFESVVEQLVENKDQLPYRFIGLDTADIAWEMAQEKVIKEWNRDNPSKRTKDIAGVGARGNSDQGYGVGYDRAKKKMRSQIDKLIKAGLGVMVLTHSKDKEIEEKNGLKYDQLVCSLPASARDVFVNMADFVAFVTIEKEKENGEVKTNRWIYLRSDGYVEAGSRFKNVPVRIPYDVDTLIDTFKEAVRSEYNSDKDMFEADKRQRKEKELKVEQFMAQKDESEDNASDLLADAISTIDQLIDNLKPLSDENKAKLGNIFMSTINTKQYKKCTDVAALQKCIEAIKTLS